MHLTFLGILSMLVAAGIGLSIGYGFGVLQRTARLKNEERERRGQVKNGWSLMPSSGQRVAYLLIALVVIQVLCPMLFSGGIEWWVSGGLAVGYGWCLYRDLRVKLASLRS